MRRILLPSLALVVVTACSSNPVRTFSGPAPAGSLACALRQGSEFGYTPVRGGVSDGYVVLERTRENDIGRALAVLPGVRRPTDGDEMTIAQTASGLRVSVNSYYLRHGVDRRKEKPSGESIGHAQQIISNCQNAAT